MELNHKNKDEIPQSSAIESLKEIQLLVSKYQTEMKTFWKETPKHISKFFELNGITINPKCISPLLNILCLHPQIHLKEALSAILIDLQLQDRSSVEIENILLLQMRISSIEHIITLSSPSLTEYWKETMKSDSPYWSDVQTAIKHYTKRESNKLVK